MEDQKVKVGLFAYQLRVDTPDKKLVDEWLEKYNVPFYLYGQEEGKLTGKKHIQAIVWFKEKLEQKEMIKLRLYFKGKTLETKQPVAFTVCRKPESLVKYVKKDGKISTNLTDEEVLRFGDWKSKEQLNKLFKEALYDYAKTIAFVPQEIEYTDQEKIDYYYTKETMYSYTSPDSDDKKEFILKIIEFYRNQKRYPVKSTINSLLFMHGYISNIELYNQFYS